jgi:hypothetical protein
MLKKKKIQRRPKATYYQIISYKNNLTRKGNKTQILKKKSAPSSFCILNGSREQSSMSSLGLQHSKSRVGESFKNPDACRSNDLEVILRDRRPREANTEKGREIMSAPDRWR